MDSNTLITLITGGVISFGFGLLAFYIHKTESKRDKRDLLQLQYTKLSINISNASLELGEATAIALKNGRCNGEVSAALESAKKVKKEYGDFLAQQCAASLQ